MGDASSDVQGVQPGAEAIRVAREVRQRPRVKKDRVRDARIVVRDPLRTSPRPDTPDVHAFGDGPFAPNERSK